MQVLRFPGSWEMNGTERAAAYKYTNIYIYIHIPTFIQGIILHNYICIIMTDLLYGRNQI